MNNQQFLATKEQLKQQAREATSVEAHRAAVVKLAKLLAEGRNLGLYGVKEAA